MLLYDMAYHHDTTIHYKSRHAYSITAGDYTLIGYM